MSASEKNITKLPPATNTEPKAKKKTNRSLPRDPHAASHQRAYEAATRIAAAREKYKLQHGVYPSRNKTIEIAGCSATTASNFLRGYLPPVRTLTTSNKRKRKQLLFLANPEVATWISQIPRGQKISSINNILLATIKEVPDPTVLPPPPRLYRKKGKSPKAQQVFFEADPVVESWLRKLPEGTLGRTINQILSAHVSQLQAA